MAAPVERCLGRSQREAGGLKAQTPSWFLLVINTEKARWLISRALALGFYPDVGGGVYMKKQ